MVSPGAPLWNNPTLPHFLKLPDPVAWTRFSIKLVKDITSDFTLHFFDHFVSHHNVPPSHLFRYLQLYHAFRSQFPPGGAQLVSLDLERVLSFECSDKPTSTSMHTSSVCPLPSYRCFISADPLMLPSWNPKMSGTFCLISWYPYGIASYNLKLYTGPISPPIIYTA